MITKTNVRLGGLVGKKVLVCAVEDATSSIKSIRACVLLNVDNHGIWLDLKAEKFPGVPDGFEQGGVFIPWSLLSWVVELVDVRPESQKADQQGSAVGKVHRVEWSVG